MEKRKKKIGYLENAKNYIESSVEINSNLVVLIKLQTLELSSFIQDCLRTKSYEEIQTTVQDILNQNKDFSEVQITELKITFFLRCSKIWFGNEDTLPCLLYLRERLLGKLHIKKYNISPWLFRIKLAEFEKAIFVIVNRQQAVDTEKQKLHFAEYEERILRLAVPTPADYYHYLFFLAQFELLRDFCTNEAPNLRYILESYFNSKSSHTGAELFGIPKKILFKIFKRKDKALNLTITELKLNLGVITSNSSGQKTFDKAMAKMDCMIPYTSSSENCIREYWKWMWSCIRVPEIRSLNFASDRIMHQPERTIDMKKSNFFKPGSHLMLYRLRMQQDHLNFIGGFPPHLREKGEEDMHDQNYIAYESLEGNNFQLS